MNQNFSSDGYAIVPGVLSGPACVEAGLKVKLEDRTAGGTRNLPAF